MSKIINEILNKIPGYRKRFMRMSMDIASQIYLYMKNSGMNQKDLAEKLNKKESEISKWLSGNHNFTIETIAKIEDTLKSNIILVPMYALEDLGIIYDTSNVEIKMYESVAAKSDIPWEIKPLPFMFMRTIENNKNFVETVN